MPLDVAVYKERRLCCALLQAARLEVLAVMGDRLVQAVLDCNYEATLAVLHELHVTPGTSLLHKSSKVHQPRAQHGGMRHSNTIRAADGHARDGYGSVHARGADADNGPPACERRARAAASAAWRALTRGRGGGASAG